MKTFVVLAALVAVACGAAVPQQRRQVFAHSAAPVHRATASPVHLAAPLHVAPSVQSRSYSSGGNVVLLKETPSNNIGLDNYQFAYELSDGSARDENAQVEVRGPEDGVLRVQGSYRFVGTDGQTYTVTYVADENGFQPQGAHLPVPPNHL